MSTAPLPLTDALMDYVAAISAPEPELLRRLAEESDRVTGRPTMRIGWNQGRFMTVLTRLIGARTALEVGVFTGTSAICTAWGLPEDGTLVALDHSQEYTDIARKYWDEAGVADKIELRLGEALHLLDGLLADGRAGGFEAAFIDADKPNQVAYIDRSIRLLRPGGMLLVDNTLWSGRVADPSNNDPDVSAIQRSNEVLRDDPRLDSAVTVIGDGLTLCRKR